MDGNTYPLPKPFFVMATQNPIELEGTFLLPEAQLDRFLLKIRLGYPEKAEEIAILERFQKQDPLRELEPVADPAEIVRMQEVRKSIRLSDPVREYIADLVRATRGHASLYLGASPRGALALMRAGQAYAALQGRDYVLPDDVKGLAVPVLAHRLILKEEELLRGETAERLVEKMVAQVPVPAPLD